jgi:hypothetical protein
MQLRDGSCIAQEPSFLDSIDNNNCCNRSRRDESSLLGHQVCLHRFKVYFIFKMIEAIYPSIQTNSRYKNYIKQLPNMYYNE